MLDVLMKAAQLGGEVVLGYREKLIISRKSANQDLLTDADVASQDKIQKTIISLMARRGIKKSGFIGEEGLNIKGADLFIIDPIDGTTNFVAGLDLFCISIAYAREGEILAGCVYLPVSKVFFVSEKGGGSYKIGKSRVKLEIKKIPLKDCLVGTYLSLREEYRLRQLEVITKIFPDVEGVRMLGGACVDLTLLAENKLNVVFNARPRIWDLAASKLIVEEAGGVMVDWQGKKIVFDVSDFNKTYPSLAAHPSTLPKLLRYFREVKPF